MTPERILLIVAATLGVLTGLGALVRTTWRGLQRVGRMMDDFGGAPARNGLPATKGVFERLNDQDEKLVSVVEIVEKVSRRQEEIGEVAAQAARDASRAVSELTRNGGASTKDQAVEAARMAQEAALTAAEVLAASRRTEALLRRHMANGVQIMEVGEHNDKVLLDALEGAGIEVDGFRPFPTVDAGTDDVTDP